MRADLRARITSLDLLVVSFNAAQDKNGFLGCKRKLQAHAELLINQHLQVLLLRAVLIPFFTQTAFLLGISLARMQDLALGLVEPQDVHTGPPLRPVQVPLDGIPSCTTQRGVIGKLAEGALDPTVHVADKGMTEGKARKARLMPWTHTHGLFTTMN